MERKCFFILYFILRLQIYFKLIFEPRRDGTICGINVVNDTGSYRMSVFNTYLFQLVPYVRPSNYPTPAAFLLLTLSYFPLHPLITVRSHRR